MKKKGLIVALVIIVLASVITSTGCIDLDLVYTKGDTRIFGRNSNEEEIEWTIHQLDKKERKLLLETEKPMTMEEFDNLIFTEEESSLLLEKTEVEGEDGTYMNIWIKLH